MRASERKDGGVLHGATLIDDEACCLSAYIHQRGTKLFVVFGQRSLSGRKLFENHVSDHEPRAINCIDRILTGRDWARYDMDFYGEPSSYHSDGIVDSVL